MFSKQRIYREEVILFSRQERQWVTKRPWKYELDSEMDSGCIPYARFVAAREKMCSFYWFPATSFAVVPDNYPARLSPRKRGQRKGKWLKLPSVQIL